MTENKSIENSLRRMFVLVAEQEPIASATVDEYLRAENSGTSIHLPRRLLIGAVASVVVIAGIAGAIVYGPRSSDMGPPKSGKNGATTQSSVATTTTGAPPSTTVTRDVRVGVVL